MNKILTTLVVLLYTTLISGQVIWTEPSFPIQSDDVTVFFDASEGDAGLQGFNGDVFAHTGVITSESSGPSDWKHVKGTWGTFDDNAKMTALGNNLYSISFNIEEYYCIDEGELVEKMAFVFRNQDGSMSGRDVGGADIFTDVYPEGNDFFISIEEPKNNSFVFLGNDLRLVLQLSIEADLVIEDNEETVYSGEVSELDILLTPQTLGNHTITISATSGTSTITETIDYVVIEENGPIENPPSGIRDGVNIVGENIIFQLYAPFKEFVFLLCPENDFNIDANYRMKKSNNGTRYWISLPASTFADNKNMYQYNVDGNIIIADPYADVVLDPANDMWVDDVILAELPPYPTGKTEGIVTVFDNTEEAYDWQVTDFEKPKKSDLVIYEILMRDFLEDHSYTSLIDTLDYLERLGVNAIELMPINEFEGNNSWGYNPSFHLAVDKYYGSRDQLKMVIDEAHKRGMAVILDVVYNHVFSQSPLAQLYWDAENFRPAENNPWLNVTPRHPFNVGYDVNHQAPQTKQWVKRSLENWIENYHFDGFRFDLSKGFTQTNSGNNAGLMSQYDASRINIINGYADYIWSLDPDSYVILEHFSDWTEEKEYADRGMLLWANNTFQFAEAAMGYSSSLDEGSYKNRGWDVPGIVSYMESHDEERMRYKIKTYGNSFEDYDTKDFVTSLERIAATASVYFSIPGPKMLWQFEELGYDYSINRCEDGSISDNCRLSPKPIVWEYYEDAQRRRLYDIFSALIHLKKNYPTFSTDDFELNDLAYYKEVFLYHEDMNAVVLANHDTRETDFFINFPNQGTWYEYMTGETIEIGPSGESFTLLPGEFKIFTSKEVIPPNGYITSTKNTQVYELEAYPTLLKNETENLVIQATDIGKVESLSIYNTTGQLWTPDYTQSVNALVLDIPKNINVGTYIVRVTTNNKVYQSKFVKI